MQSKDDRDRGGNVYLERSPPPKRGSNGGRSRSASYGRGERKAAEEPSANGGRGGQPRDREASYRDSSRPRGAGYERPEERGDRHGDRERSDRQGDRDRYERQGDRDRYERQGDRDRYERQGDRDRYERQGDRDRYERQGDRDRYERQGDRDRYERQGDRDRYDRQGERDRYERQGDRDRHDRPADRDRYERQGDRDRYEARDDRRYERPRSWSNRREDNDRRYGAQAQRGYDRDRSRDRDRGDRRGRSGSRDRRDRNDDSSGKGHGKGRCCFYYIVKKCHHGDKCDFRHPDDEERQKLYDTFTNQMCHAGVRCPRPDCIYKHPEGRKVRGSFRGVSRSRSQRR